MKRFYESVSFNGVDGGFCLKLDDRALKTPAKNDVLIPNRHLAEIIRDEWLDQGDEIDPKTMPLYGILVTAIDKEQERDAIVEEFWPYVDGDLLFYLAPEPIKLVEKQRDLWGVPCQDIESFFDIEVKITYDLGAIQQSEAYHQVMRRYVYGLDMYRFTTFHILLSVTGSPILGCLAVEGKMTADNILNIIHCEDDFYAGIYGANDDLKSREEVEKNILIQNDIVNCLNFNLTFEN